MCVKEKTTHEETWRLKWKKKEQLLDYKLKKNWKNNFTLRKPYELNW